MANVAIDWTQVSHSAYQSKDEWQMWIQVDLRHSFALCYEDWQW